MLTIHQRADVLVRESRGKMTRPEAYKELSRRGQAAKQRKRMASVPRDPSAFSGVERPYRMPYIDLEN